MPFDVVISKYNGISLYDPITKSVINNPTFFQKDLTGCDSPTHNAYSFNENFNHTSECAPPAPAFQIAVSAKSLIGLNVAMYGPQLLAYIDGADPSQIGSIFSQTMEDIGSSYRINTLDKPNGVSVSLSKLKAEQSFDPCGTSISFSKSASLSVSKKDPNTCVVTLEEAISISTIVTTQYKGVPTPFTSAALPDLAVASKFNSMINMSVTDLTSLMTLFNSTYTFPTTLTF